MTTNSDIIRAFQNTLYFLRPYKKKYIVSFLLGVVSLFIFHSIPLILKHIIDVVIPNGDVNSLLWVIGLLFGTVIVGSFCTLVYIYYSQIVRERVDLSISQALFARVENSSLQSLENQRIGDILTTINSDTTKTADFMFIILDDLPTNLCLFLYVLIVMLWLDWRLTLLSLVIVPLLIFSQYKYSKVLYDKSSILRTSFGSFMDFLEDRLRHVKLIKLFNRERDEYAGFAKRGDDVVQKSIDLSITQEKAVAVSTFLTYFSLALILGVAGYYVILGSISLGTLVAFYGYQISLYNPVNKVIRTYVSVRQHLVSVERVSSLMQMASPLPETKNPVKLTAVRGVLNMADVSLVMKNRTLVQNLNCSFLPGKIIGIVGKSGAGKTTILNLLYRFYDPARGQILLDGVDIRSIRLSEYRRHIALVPSEPTLLNESLYNNIIYGNRSATSEHVVMIAKAVGIHEYISSLPYGYNTHINSVQSELSEGQSQRLAMARALIKNPNIILFDETTAALDAESEQKAVELLRRLRSPKRTIVVVAHRLSTIKVADHIIVLDKGRVVEEGDYDSLLKQGGQFARFHYMQFSQK